MASIITLMSDSPVKLKIDYKFWIKSDSGESIMGEGKWILLKNIKDTGSLKAAVEKMGYTYRQTWENLKNIEEKIGFKLIEKSRGGAKGGQTVLTQKGEDIVAFFDKFYQNIKPVIESEIAEMQNELDRILK
jgi:molybdate transport system regulatory protein